MGIAGVMLLAAAQAASGAGLLCLLPLGLLERMTRPERWAWALLAGVVGHSFVVLLLLFAGLPLSGWPLAVLCAACCAVLFARRARWRAACSDPPPHGLPLSHAACIGLGAAVLLCSTLACALALPTHEYDGIVIWTYRVRVLLAERTLYTESLRDPLRIVAQPLHPYLVSVMEASYCLARGGFSFAAMHFPGLLVYSAYLLLCLGAAMRLESGARRAAAAAALVLMPAMAVSWPLVSAREPVMGVLGLAATVAMARWIETSHAGFLVLGAACALLMQQCKIDGLPFAAGWCAGAAIVALCDGARRGLLVRQCALVLILVFASALPWKIVRGGIQPAHMDPVLAGYEVIAGFKPANVFPVLRMIVVELLARPELFGFAGVAILAGLCMGWRRGNACRRLAVLCGPLACLVAVILIYAVRQDQLAFERNMSISRRLICLLPSLVFAALFTGRPASSAR